MTFAPWLLVESLDDKQRAELRRALDLLPSRAQLRIWNAQHEQRRQQQQQRRQQRSHEGHKGRDSLQETRT